MNCTELENIARSGKLKPRSQEPEVAAHLRECEGCRALYGDGSRLGELLCEPPTVEFDAQYAELARAIEFEDGTISGRLRSLHSTQRHMIVFAFGVLLMMLAFVTWRRLDFQMYSRMRMLLVLSTLLLLAALAGRESLRPLSKPAAPRLRLALLVASLGVPLAFAVLPEAPYLHEANQGRESVWLGALPCLTVGFGVAAPVALLWSRLHRGGDALRLRVLVAGLSGLFGNGVLQLYCPVTESEHLVLGHASVGFAFAAWLMLLAKSGRIRSD